MTTDRPISRAGWELQARRLGAAWPPDLTAAEGEFYFELLADFSEAEVVAAIDQVIREDRESRPPPGTIRARARAAAEQRTRPTVSPPAGAKGSGAAQDDAEASAAAGEGWTRVLSRFGQTPSKAEPGRTPVAPGGPQARETAEAAPPEDGPLRHSRRAVIAGAAAVGCLVLLVALGGAFLVGRSLAPDADEARRDGRAAALVEVQAERDELEDAAFSRGRSTGFRAGKSAGRAEGRRAGRREGLRQGRAAGFADGRSAGFDDGYSRGRASAIDTSNGKTFEAGNFYIAKADERQDGSLYLWTNDYPVPPGTCFSFNLQGIWTPHGIVPC